MSIHQMAWQSCQTVFCIIFKWCLLWHNSQCKLPIVSTSNWWTIRVRVTLLSLTTICVRQLFSTDVHAIATCYKWYMAMESSVYLQRDLVKIKLSICHRYYLKGPKKGQVDTFVENLPGLIDNIRPSSGGVTGCVTPCPVDQGSPCLTSWPPDRGSANSSPRYTGLLGLGMFGYK